MNCEEANQIDLVDYLCLLGYQPQKIRNQDYWYLSPLREEKEASFKVNRKKNVWYDHGLGKGGNVVEFTIQFFNCNVSEALQKVSSFHQQKHLSYSVLKTSLQKHQNLFINAINEGVEAGIKTIASKQSITNLFLYCYLKKRRINQSIANKYRRKVFGSCS